MVDLQRHRRIPHPHSHRPAKVKIAIADMNTLSHLAQDDVDVLRAAFLALTLRNTGNVAIDNKIGRALDLAKSHVLFHVREEVQEMHAQIDELVERNRQLDRENAALRSCASPETLEFLRQHRRPTTFSSSSSSGSSSSLSSPSTSLSLDDDSLSPSPPHLLQRQSSLPVQQQLQQLVASAYPSLTS